MNLVWSYADALSAANLGQAAVQDFHSFMLTDRTVTDTTIENQIRIEYAGLALMAGDSALARDLVDEPRGVRGSRIPPELMGRLGWWYYRAAKYSEAEALLRRLAQERPGDERLQNDLAWVELEHNEFEAAIPQFTRAEWRVGNGSAQWNTPQMGLAIALWRSHRVDEALKNYASAANAEPRWTNPLLVRAFYSPQVAQSVAEMQAEQASASKRESALGSPLCRIDPARGNAKRLAFGLKPPAAKINNSRFPAYPQGKTGKVA